MERTCNDCGSSFLISEASRRFHDKKRIPLPCRCPRCRRISRPQLWYVNGETLDVESVSVLQNAGTLRILYHNKAYVIDRDVLGKRLFLKYIEAWITALFRKQAKEKKSRAGK